MVNNIIQKRRQCNKRSNGITSTERRSNGNIPLSYAPEGRKTTTRRNQKRWQKWKRKARKGGPRLKKGQFLSIFPNRKKDAGLRLSKILPLAATSGPKIHVRGRRNYLEKTRADT